MDRRAKTGLDLSDLDNRLRWDSSGRKVDHRCVSLDRADVAQLCGGCGSLIHSRHARFIFFPCSQGNTKEKIVRISAYAPPS